MNHRTPSAHALLSDRSYVVGSRVLTGKQLARAIEVADRLVRAYAVASPDNDGSGSVDWNAIDGAYSLATLVLQPEMDKMQAWAQLQNAVEAMPEDLMVAERKKADDTEGGSQD
jgi:hypothetical protein